MNSRNPEITYGLTTKEIILLIEQYIHKFSIHNLDYLICLIEVELRERSYLQDKIDKIFNKNKP